MTSLFITLLAAVALLAGGSVPCFFKSSRFVAGCLLLSAAVVTAAVGCFVTPVASCMAAFSRFDIIYFSSLFAASFFVSLFWRRLLGVAFFFYLLWCSAMFVSLLTAGFSSSGLLCEVEVQSPGGITVVADKLQLSAYQLLPFRPAWFRAGPAGEASSDEIQLLILTSTGAILSSEPVCIPSGTVYPRLYAVSAEKDGAVVAEPLL